MGPIGLPELLLIAAVALVVFGPARLPELGRSLGRAMREFRSAVRALDDDSPNGSGQGDGTGRGAAPATPAQGTGPAAPAGAAGPARGTAADGSGTAAGTAPGTQGQDAAG